MNRYLIQRLSSTGLTWHTVKEVAGSSDSEARRFFWMFIGNARGITYRMVRESVTTVADNNDGSVSKDTINYPYV